MKYVLCHLCVFWLGLSLTVGAQPAPASQGGQPAARRWLTWQGEYVGWQRIADVRRPFADGSYAVTFLTIIGIGQRSSCQFQIIAPLGVGWRAPVYRVAFDYKLF